MKRLGLVWFRNNLRLHDNEVDCDIALDPSHVVFRIGPRLGACKQRLRQSSLLFRSAANHCENVQVRFRQVR